MDGIVATDGAEIARAGAMADAEAWLTAEAACHGRGGLGIGELGVCFGWGECMEKEKEKKNEEVSGSEILGAHLLKAVRAL